MRTLVETSRNYMRQIIEIKPEWLLEVAKHYFTNEDIQDSSGKKVPKYVANAGSGAAAANAQQVFA